MTYRYHPRSSTKEARAHASSGKKKACLHARTGRGAVALFDVSSNEELHGLLNEWAEIVPAEFDIYPLIDPEAIKSFLAKDAE